MGRENLNFERDFQIGNTGISQNYFNTILGISDPEVIRDPNRFGYGDRKPALREFLVYKLTKDNTFVTYTDYIKAVVENRNSPMRGYDGELYAASNPVSIDDFIDDSNKDTVRELDGIVMDLKKLGENPPEEIDLEHLLDLMYKASLLIYGPKFEERLKKRFYSDRR